MFCCRWDKGSYHPEIPPLMVFSQIFIITIFDVYLCG